MKLINYVVKTDATNLNNVQIYKALDEFMKIALMKTDAKVFSSHFVAGNMEGSKDKKGLVCPNTAQLKLADKKVQRVAETAKPKAKPKTAKKAAGKCKPKVAKKTTKASKVDKTKAAAMRKAGATNVAIGKKFGVSEATIRNVLGPRKAAKRTAKRTAKK